MATMMMTMLNNFEEDRNYRRKTNMMEFMNSIKALPAQEMVSCIFYRQQLYDFISHWKFEIWEKVEEEARQAGLSFLNFVSFLPGSRQVKTETGLNYVLAMYVIEKLKSKD